MSGSRVELNAYSAIIEHVADISQSITVTHHDSAQHPQIVASAVVNFDKPIDAMRFDTGSDGVVVCIDETVVLHYIVVALDINCAMV